MLYGWTYGFDYALSDEYVLDAIAELPNNLHGFLNAFSQLYAGNDYRPVTILSFCIERFLFSGSSPHVSHLVNVFLYGIINIKLYDFVVVSKFDQEEKKLPWLALLTAFLFLIHPNHVSVVANIKSRDNLLSMLFGLLTAIQLIKASDQKQYIRLLPALFYITLALLSKRDAYIFAVIPALIILLFREVRYKKVAVYFGMTIALFIISNWVRDYMAPNTISHTGALSIAFDKNPLVADDSVFNRISMCLTSLFYYIKFLFVPVGYHFIFGYNQIPLQPLFSFPNIVALFSIIIFFALALFRFKKNKIYLFCFLFFILSIAYALNLLQIVSNIVMDRYDFIPSFAFCLAVAAIFTDLTRAEAYKIFKTPALVLLSVLFIAFTVYRTKDWRNMFTLVKHDMPYLKQSVNANRIAAAIYINEALNEETKPAYNKQYADSMINIGEKYTLDGLKIYDQVVELWEERGLCSFYRKDYPAALTYYLTCRRIDSNYLSALNYAGFTYWRLNNFDSAYYYFNYVVNREDYFGYAANNLLDLLYTNNHPREGDSILNIMKKKYPDDMGLKNKITTLGKNAVVFH